MSPTDGQFSHRVVGSLAQMAARGSPLLRHRKAQPLTFNYTLFLDMSSVTWSAGRINEDAINAEKFQQTNHFQDSVRCA